MARSLDSATKTAFQQPSLWLIWIIRLNVQTDPVYIHTGIGDLTFPGGSGYDANLVGPTFKGIANAGTIDPITDDVNGSQSLNLTLPGVQLHSDYLNQFINNGDLWQRYPAYLWVATCDNTGAIVGKPARVKSARMDKLAVAIDPGNNTGTLIMSLESQQAYSGQALASRYIEQSQIDSTDISQNFITDLANRVPAIGNNSTATTSGVAGTVKNILTSTFGPG